MNVNVGHLADLEKLVKFARKHGLKSISYEGVTLTLGDASPKRTRTQPGEPKKLEERLPEFTDDQVLNWSSGEE